MPVYEDYKVLQNILHSNKLELLYSSVILVEVLKTYNARHEFVICCTTVNKLYILNHIQNFHVLKHWL